MRKTASNVGFIGEPVRNKLESLCEGYLQSNQQARRLPYYYALDSPAQSAHQLTMSTTAHSRPVIRYLDKTTPPHISTLILMVGVSTLTMNIFLPSLQGMADYFDVDYRVMQLSVALYLGMNAVMQLIVGPISDRFGRRPVVLTAIVLFILMSLGCIFAPNATVFLCFRMAQAVIVTAMVLSRAIIRDMVPASEAASMMGYVTMGMAVIPMIAPGVGGILDTLWGWQASFWVMALTGVALLIICWKDQGETAVRREGGFRRQVQDMPELLMSPRFWGYATCSALTAGAFFSYLGGATFVGEELFHMSKIKLGFFFGAPAIGYMAGNYISGRYSVRIGITRMIATGTCLGALGTGVSLLIFVTGYGSEHTFFGFMIFVGLGNGMVIPNATAGALSVRPHLAGSASGLSGSIMLAGGAALSALAGSLLTHDTGATPLLWMMFLVTAAAGVVILLVARRDAKLATLQ